MCGIAGWVTVKESPDPGVLGAMVDALAQRNRDGEALSAVIDRHPRRSVVLAAARVDEPSGISLALDGTILNAAELRDELARRGHSFSKSNDLEVLLRAYQHWDKELVKQLRGAFAFALWDERKDRLMLARDRFGQKPLYLAEAGGALWFASEARALARAPGVAGEVDVAAVGEYLALGYVRGPRTLLAGVRKLAPGSYALWQRGSLREARYWSLPDGEAMVGSPRGAALGSRHGGDAVASFIAELGAAVQANLAGAKPAGVLLTRGYDSAAIVALARHHSTALETFSAGFAEDKRSELAAAGALARHFGTRHHEIVLEKRELLAHLPELVASRDAPFCRPADVALHLIARHAARHVRVALSGDGGDEILGGYRRHTFLRGFAPKRPRPGGLFVIPVEAVRAEEEAQLDGKASALRRILYYEQAHGLADNVLERSERMAASAALELRAPFVDHRLAEHVSRLPDAQRVRALSTKWILRRADERLLADVPVKPRKGGFRIALADLLRGEMRDLVADHLRGPGCRTRAYYDPGVLERLVDEHLAARRNHEEILWTLLNLEIWHRNYHRTARPPQTAAA